MSNNSTQQYSPIYYEIEYRDGSKLNPSEITDDFAYLRLFLARFFRTLIIYFALFAIFVLIMLFSNLSTSVAQIADPLGALVNSIVNATLINNNFTSIADVNAGCYFIGTTGSCLPQPEIAKYTPIPRSSTN